MEDFIGKYDGNQIDSRLDKVKDMVGATASQAGEDGLVPAPAKGDEGRFLCGDGTWKDVVVEPDYTVFDIVVEILQMDIPSISQENYDHLISIIQEDNGIPNSFAIRPLSLGICLLIGTKNSGIITLTLDSFRETHILLNSCVITIDSNLSVSINRNVVSYDLDDSTLAIGGFTAKGEQGTYNSITFQTKGDKSESLMADGKYRKLPVYGRNLLLGSGKEVSNSNYNIADYWLTEPISKGTQVTLTIFGELGDDKEMFTIYNSTGAVGSMAQFSKADFVNGKASKTFKWITNIGDAVADNTHMVVFSSPKTGTSTSTIHKIKLEYGDISTEWSPAWEDIPDLEERYAYGVEWDTASSSPDGVRVGNMQLHRELPIQSKIRGVILDNKGGIKSYLNNSN